MKTPNAVENTFNEEISLRDNLKFFLSELYKKKKNDAILVKVH